MLSRKAQGIFGAVPPGHYSQQRPEVGSKEHITAFLAEFGLFREEATRKVLENNLSGCQQQRRHQQTVLNRLTLDPCDIWIIPIIWLSVCLRACVCLWPLAGGQAAGSGVACLACNNRGCDIMEKLSSPLLNPWTTACDLCHQPNINTSAHCGLLCG